MRGSSGSNPTQLGGALMRKLVGLLATAAIVVAACGGTSTTPAPATAAPTDSTGNRSPGQRARFGGARFGGGGGPRPLRDGLQPGARHARWHDDHRRLAGSHPVQPVLLHPGHRGQRRLVHLAQPADDQPRLQVHPAARRRADPDDRQRWRHRRPERRRDDRHLEAPRRPQVVRRRAPHLRRLQVRVGVGPRQGQHRHQGRLGEHQGLRVRVRHGHDLALRRHLLRAT